MPSPLWDVDRVHAIGSIMSRYAPHLRVGDRLRLGCEGDPCSRYRGGAEAPSGTIVDLTRDDELVRIEMRMDSGETRSLTNLSILPDECWEIHPEYVETFRGRPRRGDSAVATALRRGAVSAPRPPTTLHRRLGTVATGEVRESLGLLRDQLFELEARFRRAEETQQSFRETMASTVRHIAGDVYRSARGESIEFSPSYIDRFDVTREEGRHGPYRGSADRHDRHASRGSADRHDRHASRGSADRHDRHASRERTSRRKRPTPSRRSRTATWRAATAPTSPSEAGPHAEAAGPPVARVEEHVEAARHLGAGNVEHRPVPSADASRDPPALSSSAATYMGSWRSRASSTVTSGCAPSDSCSDRRPTSLATSKRVRTACGASDPIAARPA